MTLEEYLSDQFNRDELDVIEIERGIAKIVETFLNAFDKKNGLWPYERRAAPKTNKRQKQENAPSFSQSTTAMILCALGRSLGICTIQNGSVADGMYIPKHVRSGIEKIVRRQETKLLENTTINGIRSGTFGNDNPITASHVSDFLFSFSHDQKNSTLVKNLTEKCTIYIENLSKIAPNDGNFTEKCASQEQNKRDISYVSCAFLALRITRARHDLKSRKATENFKYRDFFESRLHDQLSFSSIPDSRFDPAELAFCLEGLLICAKEAVDPILFERVLSVLSSTQQTSAYWRPTRPFVARNTGEVILPISVEGANSLLRSVEIMDSDRLHATFAATAIPMFRRFYQWLRARRVEFKFRDLTFVGWHSEHVNEAGTIHLWDTSQVLEFFVEFRSLLRKHIARETLVLSRVKIDEPAPYLENWEKLKDKFEPLTGSNIALKIYDAIEHDFIIPWQQKNKDRNYSILLYGPPGTGKTTVAKNIANALGFRRITITVSDFLGSGGAMVEARAKAIFKMLESQEDVVILFDEIDAFLLDRDSEHYRRQDTLFQFLTPGMLTKINDLRSMEKSIFIIATNYESRIDAAIKRPGRIDRKYLLLPPDMEKRTTIIRSKYPGKGLPSARLKEMAEASLYLGYKEISGAIAMSRADGSNAATRLKQVARSSSHTQYLGRAGKETFPTQEFKAIAALAEEAGQLDDLNEAIEALPESQIQALRLADVNRKS